MARESPERQPPPDQARIVFFDIEATGLDAAFGHVLAFGYKTFGEPRAHVLSLHDVPKPKPGAEPDSRLLRRIHTILTHEADVIVSFYGKEYDRKFLNTRMLMSGLPPLPPLSSEHVDLYYTVRNNLKLHSNRLQGVSEALGCPMSKSPVRADTWRLATRGDREAMREVVEHCRLDVEILEWCYRRLRPFIRQHPPVTPYREACRVCGSTQWQSKGWRFRMGGRHQRLQCQGCGAWTYRTETGRQVA